MRRTGLAPSIVCLLLAACGDDPKQGSRGAPVSAPSAGAGPATPVPAPGPAAPAPQERPSVPATTPARPASPAFAPPIPALAGDWAAWEVRSAASEAVTTLTWRVLRVEGGRARVSVASVTRDATGAAIASQATEAWHPVAGPAAPPDALVESVAAARGTMEAWVAAEGETRTWRSPEVPFGVVRVVGPGGLEQVLTGFGRGR